MNEQNGVSPQGFDISGQKAVVASREDEGTVIHVRNEVGDHLHFGEDKKPVTILVAGSYSTVYRKALDAQRDRMMKHRRLSATGEQLARNQLELIAACVLSWEGFCDGPKVVPCTKENAITILSLFPWIREDVEAAMGDHQSFFKNSSPTS